VDAERGLLVTDRHTVPVAMGDVRLTFAGAVEIPAEVIFVHPIHNLAFVQYDPALLGDTPVKSAELNSEPLAAGDPVGLIGVTESQRVQIYDMQPFGPRLAALGDRKRLLCNVQTEKDHNTPNA